jgi:hypothetical protein
MILARRALGPRWLIVCLPTVLHPERILGRAGANPTSRPLCLPNSAWADRAARVVSRRVSASGAVCERISSSRGSPFRRKDRKGIW